MPRKLNPEELASFNSYHKAGGGNLNRCKINNISLSLHETDEHNLKMIEICKEYYSKGYNFITEAVPNDNKKRRIDIVILGLDGNYKKGGLWIEIETDKRRMKPDADISYVLENGEWKVYIKE